MPREQSERVTRQQAIDGVARVRERLHAAAARSGRRSAEVRIVAATKYLDEDGCAALVDAGITDLAESRLGTLAARQRDGADASLSEAVTWHFIGRLQSRQARELAGRTAMIHTLCTTSAAARLADALVPAPRLLVQVNVDRDPAKDGLAPEAVERFLTELPGGVEVGGFMAMPAFTDDPEASRPAFAALRTLRDELAPRMAGRHQLDHLSIGTSQDWEVAVEEGATLVRLGRILYARGE